MGINKALLLAVACLGTTSILADDVNYVMKIALLDGTVDTYVVDERPQVTLDDKFVKVWTNDISARYDANAVANYTFADIAKKDIREMQEGGDIADPESVIGITFKYVDGETMIVSGIKADDTISCSSLSGQRVDAEIDRYRDSANISLRNLAPGTYIISINNSKSIKVLKR